jgi:DNA polymerase alpha-associated DNA helicase A
MNQTMEKLQKMGESEYSSFIRVLFGLSSPSPVPQNLSTSDEVGNIEWIDPTLNDSQKDAIQFALASREVALIHGPPGVSDQSTASCDIPFLPQVLGDANLDKDRQDSHSDRADSTND